MNGAYMAVTAASLTAGLAVFYAHYNQISERDVSTIKEAYYVYI